jgi:hypothetical protein
VNGCLLVTLEGNVLEDPHNILRLLSKRAKARNKARLEARVSTNRNKDIAPPIPERHLVGRRCVEDVGLRQIQLDEVLQQQHALFPRGD